MKLSLGQIAKACQGILSDGADASNEVIGITWDSREVQPGWLYVALPGERVDGHDFVERAAQAGAICSLVARPIEGNYTTILVEDTQVAFTALAAYWRTCLTGTVFALTGSTGKTTTKTLIRDVLGTKGSVVATKANQNNELGVPRTLFNAEKDTDFIVVEMGMRGLGQIAELCEIAKPAWGLITNIGESHMELLGSRDNIAHAKAELFGALPDEKGVAFINACDDYAQKICIGQDLNGRKVTQVFFDGTGKNGKNQVMKFAADHSPMVWISDLVFGERGYPSFVIHSEGFHEKYPNTINGQHCCSLGLKGAHNVINACAAAAVGLQAGLTLEECCKALEASRPESGRQQLCQAACGALIINDAYNANPDSMVASLTTFATFEVVGARIAVLGDMGELGSVAEEAHSRVGAIAATVNLDKLICVGELSHRIAEGARLAGMSEEAIVISDTLEEALDVIEEGLGPDDAVLVKASHFMGFDKIVEGLVG